jgi:hypothetical protein
MNQNRLLVGGGLVVLFGIVLYLTHNKSAKTTSSTATTGTAMVSGTAGAILVPSAQTLSPQDQEAYANGALPIAGVSSHSVASMGITQIGPGLAILNNDPSVSYEPLGLPSAQQTILGI